MRRHSLVAALALAGPAAAVDPPPGPPDAELLEFLGESAGVDHELVQFMVSREAERALEEAAKKDPKEDDDE
jgi:hypothetical protein